MKRFTLLGVGALVLASSLMFGTSPKSASAATSYETEITYGVNFRTNPSSDSRVYRQLSRGTDVHVISKVNAYWLKVMTKDGRTGYISAGDKYTTYGDATKSISSKASRIIATAKSYKGDFKYKWGAEPWNTGYRYSDCSSFVQLVFNKKHGFNLPRTSKAQSKVGKYVSKSNLKAGDLVFFDTDTNGSVNHVGIYIGNGDFIHSSPVNKVGTNDLNSGWWEDHYVTARREL